MGTGTWVMVGIGAWIVLSLPVGLLIGAMVRSTRCAPQRSGPSAVTVSAMAACSPASAPVALTRVERLVQV